MKIREGLKGLRVAELKEDLSKVMTDDGVAKVTYGEIKHLKNVQNMDLTMRTQTADVDADDETTTLSKCTGCDGKVQRTMFSPEELAMLLDETILKDGSVVSTSVDEPTEFATGFYCKMNGGKYLAMWLFRTKYSTADFAAETSGAEKLNPQSDSISFKSMSRKADKAWRRYAVVDSEAEAEAFLTVEKLQELIEKPTKTDNPTDEGDSSGEDGSATTE